MMQLIAQYRDYMFKIKVDLIVPQLFSQKIMRHLNLVVNPIQYITATLVFRNFGT
jgi:hypothetical protein